MSRFKFVWWGWSYAFMRPFVTFRTAPVGSMWRRMYRWTLILGPLEIRRRT